MSKKKNFNCDSLNLPDVSSGIWQNTSGRPARPYLNVYRTCSLFHDWIIYYFLTPELAGIPTLPSHVNGGGPANVVVVTANGTSHAPIPNGVPLPQPGSVTLRPEMVEHHTSAEVNGSIRRAQMQPQPVLFHPFSLILAWVGVLVGD